MSEALFPSGPREWTLVEQTTAPHRFAKHPEVNFRDAETISYSLTWPEARV
jgi:hypothetical protein